MKKNTLITCAIFAVAVLVICFFRVLPGANLAAAVRSKDEVRISMGFSELIHDRGISGARIKALISPYLADPNPRVRYEAARSLSLMGDDRGVDGLIALVESQTAISGSGGDLRIHAAYVLAKYREYRALNAVISLHSRGSPSLLPALMKLRDPDMISKLERRGFVQNRSSILDYGRQGVMSFQPQISQVFESSSDPEMRVAAAFALFRFGGDERYVDYLINEARKAFETGVSADGSLNAVQCLGSVDSAKAALFLESLLPEKGNVLIVRTAMVNLIINQSSPSQKALDFLLSELSGTMETLGADLTLTLAARLTADSRFDAAGRAFDLGAGGSSWKRYSVERKNWSQYNWVDDYVVDLKADRIAVTRPR